MLLQTLLLLQSYWFTDRLKTYFNFLPQNRLVLKLFYKGSFVCYEFCTDISVQ